MSVVNAIEDEEGPGVEATPVVWCEAAQSRRWGAETTVDQTLIRGLITAFRVSSQG